MEGFLFGLSATVVVVIGGLLATFGNPGAMFDALLAPFSNGHRRRHFQYKIDSYYQGLTKERLQSQLRSGLLSRHSRDGWIIGLRQVSGQQNALHRIFDEFAVSHGQEDRKVWTENQFIAFILSRLGDDGAARALWRCFCYSATYPFTDRSRQTEQQQIDMDSWAQAIALLTTDAARSVGYNRAQLSLYGPPRVTEARILSAWHRFISFATSSAGGIAEDNDHWHPPNELDEVTSVAATQLPLDMSIARPSLSEIRPNVQKLVDEACSAQISVSDYAIPYQDLLNSLCAVLQVIKEFAPGEYVNDESRPSLSVDVDRDHQAAVAKGILEIGGINEDSTVSFANFFAFWEKFDSHDQWGPRSLDQELATLWRALFPASDSNSSASSSSHQLPPTLVLQAVEILYPLQQSPFDGHNRYLSTLVYSADSNISRDGVIKALTWPFGPKFVIIYGTTTDVPSQERTRRTRSSMQNPEDGKPAIFVILTSSPLWCIYKTGEINDFLVGDAHLLLEIAPRPRCLWFAGEQMKYADLVDTSGDTIISFGGRNAACTSAAGARSSGLTLDFDTGVATLHSLPAQVEGQERGYVEIPVGPRDGPTKKVNNPEAWETAIRIQKVEVYKGPDGVNVDLITKRVESRGCLRPRVRG